MNRFASTNDRGAGALARVRRVAFAGVLATGTALALPALTGAASAATPTGVCPAVGHATDCGVLITIGATGSVTIQNEGNGNPYDGHDDTLIGVVNDSTASLASITLTSTEDIFGFDGDGICTYASHDSALSYCTSANDPTHPDTLGADYEGPINTFSNITDHDTKGEVDFTGGLAGGSSTFFSLENDLVGCGSSGDDTPTVVSHTATVDCVSIPTANLTVDKVDNTGKALEGAVFTVYGKAGQQDEIGTCDASASGTCTLTSLAAGEYWIDETTTPAGYQTAAEQTVLVLGSDVSVKVTDDPVPATPVVPVAPTGGTATTTTTTTTTAPPTAAVTGATTVHTGESFAGSRPYELAVAGAGAGLLGAGMIERRRRARHAAVRR